MMSSNSVCISLAIISALICGHFERCLAIGSIQSSAARGQLLCKGKPYEGAKIKLYDIDLTDFDDLMGETKSGKDGRFYVSGNETELTTIDPKINIYHNCEDENRECLRKIQIILPKDFVTEGVKPAKVFDAGILNLSGQFPVGRVVTVRAFASEADPEDYGYYPDPIEHASGREKKMIIARLAGDDRYEPKVYYRSEEATREKPNLVPAHFDDQLVGCLCEPDAGHVNFMVIRKGAPKRCECGNWFKAIDCDPEMV